MYETFFQMAIHLSMYALISDNAWICVNHCQQMCAIIDACERLGGFNQMEIREMLKDWVDHGVLVNHVGGPYEKYWFMEC